MCIYIYAYMLLIFYPATVSPLFIFEAMHGVPTPPRTVTTAWPVAATSGVSAMEGAALASIRSIWSNACQIHVEVMSESVLNSKFCLLEENKRAERAYQPAKGLYRFDFSLKLSPKSPMTIDVQKLHILKAMVGLQSIELLRA